MPKVTCEKCGGTGTLDTPTSRKSKNLGLDGKEQDVIFKSLCDVCGGTGEVKV